MSKLTGDLQKLRMHLALACAALLVSALLLLWGIRYDRESNVQYNTASSQLRQAESRLRRASSEEQEIRQKATLFTDLHQKGIIGPENRLEWTEMLAALPGRLGLPSLEYEFMPQAAIEGANAGGYTFFRSSLLLRLGLLHEEDLLRALGTIEREARALVYVRHCKLARPTSADATHTPPPLNAECELDWITAAPLEIKRP